MANNNTKAHKSEKYFNELIKKFKHRFEGKVRFSEVDSFHIVHNLQYLYWVEWARAEYLSDVGILIDKETYRKSFPVVIAHAEIDYFNPAQFADEYVVWTRVNRIGDTSVDFENYVTMKDNTPLALAKCTLVLTDPVKGVPRTLPDDIRAKLINYEGDSLTSKSIA